MEVYLCSLSAEQILQQMALYFFYINLSKKIWLDVSCESSA